MPIEYTDTSLNTGSKALLDQLPDGAGQLVEAMAKERGVPLWHTVAGILLEAHTEGRLSAITIDPAWKVGFKKKLSVCQYCHRRFVPKHVNQPFCSDRCGQIVEYEKRLADAPKPIKPKSDKHVQDMENYIADVRYRQELEEIIQLLKSGVPIEEPEPVRRNSGGTDLGSNKHLSTVGSTNNGDNAVSDSDKIDSGGQESKIQTKPDDKKDGNRTISAGG